MRGSTGSHRPGRINMARALSRNGWGEWLRCGQADAARTRRGSRRSTRQPPDAGWRFSLYWRKSSPHAAADCDQGRRRVAARCRPALARRNARRMPAWLTTQLAPVQLTLDYRFAAGRDSALKRLLRRSLRIKVVPIERTSLPAGSCASVSRSVVLRSRFTLLKALRSFFQDPLLGHESGAGHYDYFIYRFPGPPPGP